jgi:hypothetical protein
MNRRFQRITCLRSALGIVMLIAFAAPEMVKAQVPPLVEAELVKLGPIVEPGCTAKLYRPLFGKNDYNAYWPVDAAMPNKTLKLYPGVTVSRDVSYGPQPKDLIDIFVPEKGGANRTVFIFVPGGAGNKIEQQSVEANMFYDNIGKWAADNGMIGVTMQRGGTAAGQNVALVVEWLQANVDKYKGNSANMFIMAHSAGNQPLGQYIGRPDLYGLGVKGAIFMAGNPVNFGGGVAGGARGGGAPGGGRGGAGGPGGAGGRGGGTPGANGTSMCTNTAGAGSQAGVIRGPSSQLADMGAGAAARRAELAGTSPWRWDGKEWVSTGATSTPAPAAAGGAAGGGGGARGGGGFGGGAGGAGGGRGGAGGPGGPGGAPGGGQAGAPGGAAAAPAAPAFTTQDGFRTTRAKIALAWGEIDIDTTAAKGMPTGAVAIHDELCKLEGPKAKDGVGHCPTMMWFKGESHMSEVFSLGSIDKTVSDPLLAFIKQNQ